jgi:hypothetical protein
MVVIDDRSVDGTGYRNDGVHHVVGSAVQRERAIANVFLREGDQMGLDRRWSGACGRQGNPGEVNRQDGGHERERD